MLDGSATADVVQGPGGGSRLTFLRQGGTLERRQAAPFGATPSGFGGTLTVADGTLGAAFQLAGRMRKPGSTSSTTGTVERPSATTAG